MRHVLPPVTAKMWADLAQACAEPGRDPHRVLAGRIDRASLGRDWPMVMALGNAALADCHPGKLTREDVETLRTVATVLPPVAAERLRAVAAKVAALLPPPD